MSNKSNELTASVRLINDRLNFSGSVQGNQSISIDYIPPLGDNLGYTSLELLLLSLSSCVGSTVAIFLRRMNKSFSDLEILAKGIRKEDHPTGFKKIILEFNLKSENISKSDLDNVIKLSEETYCPVWSMLKGNVEIETMHNISK